ncbi:MAG: peptide MFS transporter [Saprospiraceae bacterium]|nr:peptide MFS transporter [Saprospiraceae bacterium]
MDITLIAIIFFWVFCIIWVPIIIAANKKTHPKALFILFFAEMWERFSYYGMRAILLLYMTRVLFEKLGSGADAKAVAIYGSYTAGVYLFPILGGVVADKFFGFRRSIILGGALMVLGHFTLAVMGFVDETNTVMFFLSLALIIVGNGYFKPNISSFLGKFYDQADVRKDAAFNIFYMGINVGALLSIFTVGYIGEKVNWHLGFGLAGIFMVLGLLVFWFNQDKLEGKGLVPDKKNDTEKVFAGLSRNNFILLGSLLLIPLFALMMEKNELFSKILLMIGVVVFLGLFIYGAILASQGQKKEGQRLWVVVILALFNVIFWALFEQAGGSLTLYADKFTNRNVFGSEVPASVIQGFNSMFIIILAPAFAWMWSSLAKAKKDIGIPLKFVLGLAFLALGFYMVVLGGKSIGDAGKVSLIFLILMYLFHTIGELFLSPIGLSMVSKLSPAKLVGFIMGVWFLSFSLANNLGGIIGKLNSEASAEGSIAEQLATYSETYMNLGVYLVLGAAALLLLLTPFLNRWTHGIK